jgi:hypothetical protein
MVGLNIAVRAGRENFSKKPMCPLLFFTARKNGEKSGETGNRGKIQPSPMQPNPFSFLRDARFFLLRTSSLE